MIISGIAQWAKILTPGKNYDGDGLEYSMDLVIDEDTVAALKEVGLGPKVKTGKYDGPHIKFDLPTKAKKTGKDLTPPSVKDRYGRDWDKDVLIGNGSEVEVRFDVRTGEMRGTQWCKPGLREVKVVDLVEVGERMEYEKPSRSDSQVAAEEVWEDDKQVSNFFNKVRAKIPDSEGALAYCNFLSIVLLFALVLNLYVQSVN